jgi:hypothetical protein
MRDDFSVQTKRALALRVGYRCSRPDCGALTSGPQEEPSKAVNVGVAAHITAASRGGPRFDPLLTLAERAAAANGIWVCQNCAKLIDDDAAQFTIEVLQRWKIDREADARRQVGIATNQLKNQQVSRLIVELHVGEYVVSDISRTPKFIFKVANPNERPVTVCGAGVESLAGGVSAPVFRPELNSFPQQLADGQSFMFMSPIDYFASQLRAKKVATPVQVIGYVTDTLGNQHESTPVPFPE